MATTSQIQTDFKEVDYEFRTPELHKFHIKKLSESYSLNSVEYGINSPSALDEVPNFSVVQNIPHDVMHDLLEGIIPYEMKLLLTHLVVDSKYFTIATLNDRLKRFNFGYSELSDVPSEIDEKVVKNVDTKIRQSASRMWAFATFFPLLVGDLIPEDDQRYSLFLLLIKICSIAMSWEVSLDMISYIPWSSN